MVGILPYLLAAFVAVGGAAWLVHDIKAPLQREISDLRKASADKEVIAERDRHRAEVAEAEAERRDATLESYLHEAKKSGSKLTSVELDRLRELAGARSAARR